MFISLTHPTKGAILIDNKQISHIVEDAATNDVVVCMVNSQDSFSPTETITAIFAQQDTTGYNLNMISVSNTKTGNQEIWFTHSLWKILDDPGGSLLVTRYRKDRIFASQNLATILGYQGAATNLGLVSVTVVAVPPKTNTQFILLDHTIKEMISKDPAVPAGNTLIHMKGSHETYEVTETIAALQAAMPI